MARDEQNIGAGTKLGEYTILREIGEGACAKVFEAQVDGPHGFHKSVALKVVHQQLVEAQPQIVRSMINEARIGGLLSHPNVVQIFQFEELDGQHVLVMEHVEGPTFRDLLDDLSTEGVELPPGIVAEAGAQVCRALQYAIERPGTDGEPLRLVHRDLKPENLILGPGGQVKVLDFGIARSTANLYLTTTLNLTRGTPCYMSPEQLRGESLDGRSDLFSLGCVLYELLTGKVLFEAAGFKLVEMVLEGDLTAQFATVHERSPALADVIAGLLERPLKRRIPNALQAEKMLAEVARTEPADPDLAGLARLYERGEKPRWDGTIKPRPQDLKPSAPPPSGKAGNWIQRLLAWFGF